MSHNVHKFMTTNVRRCHALNTLDSTIENLLNKGRNFLKRGGAQSRIKVD